MYSLKLASNESPVLRVLCLARTPLDPRQLPAVPGVELVVASQPWSVQDLDSKQLRLESKAGKVEVDWKTLRYVVAVDSCLQVSPFAL